MWLNGHTMGMTILEADVPGLQEGPSPEDFRQGLTVPAAVTGAQCSEHPSLQGSECQRPQK